MLRAELNKAGTAFGCKAASSLKSLAFACSSQIARLAMTEDASVKAAFEASGLQHPPAAQFISQAGEAARLHIGRSLAAADSRVRQHMSEGAEILKGLPDPDAQEADYRGTLQRLTGKLVDVQQALLSDLPPHAAWAAAHGQEAAPEVTLLQKEASHVRDEAMRHVCFYSLLCLYRTGQQGSSALATKEQVAKMTSILGSLSALPAATWGSNLLADMRAFVVPPAGESDTEARGGRLSWHASSRVEGSGHEVTGQHGSIA